MLVSQRNALTLLVKSVLVLFLIQIFIYDKEYQQKLATPKVQIHWKYQRENATFVVLALEKDLKAIVRSLMSYEVRFNRKYKYNWVFLTNRKFSAKFQKIVTKIVSGRASFEYVPPEMWSQVPSTAISISTFSST